MNNSKTQSFDKQIFYWLFANTLLCWLIFIVYVVTHGTTFLYGILALASILVAFILWNLVLDIKKINSGLKEEKAPLFLCGVIYISYLFIGLIAFSFWVYSLIKYDSKILWFLNILLLVSIIMSIKQITFKIKEDMMNKFSCVVSKKTNNILHFFLKCIDKWFCFIVACFVAMLLINVISGDKTEAKRMLSIATLIWWSKCFLFVVPFIFIATTFYNLLSRNPSSKKTK
jgi:hypothetical protein